MDKLFINPVIEERLSDLIKASSTKNNKEINNQNLSCCELFIIHLFNLLLFPFAIFYFCVYFITNNKNDALVLIYFGKIRNVILKPGLFLSIPYFREVRQTTLKVQTIKLNNINISDIMGNPLNISGVINFKIYDPVLALYTIQDYNEYIITNANSVLKLLISRFKYANFDDDSEPTLLNDTNVIGHYLKLLLEKRVTNYGIKITRFEILDLNYDKEISQAMLQIQQAKAKINAKKYIVEGSANIVDELTK